MCRICSMFTWCILIDVDVCFIAPPGSKASKQSAVKLVHTFGNILRRACPAGSHVDFVTRTRIPILKLHIAHPLIGAGIQLDLSFENHAALENTSLIQAYCRVDDRLRPVVMFGTHAEVLHIICADEISQSNFGLSNGAYVVPATGL